MKKITLFTIAALLVFGFVSVPGVFAESGEDEAASVAKPKPRDFIKCGDFRYAISHSDDGESRLTIKDRKGKILLNEMENKITTSGCAGLSEKPRVWGLSVQRWSGGAHCCFDNQVYLMTGTFKVIFRFPAWNSPNWEFLDLDKDGVNEILTDDDRFAAFEDLSYAESPDGPPMTFCYDGMEYRDCSFKFPKRLGNPSPSEENGESLGMIALAYFLGEHEKWWRIFKRTLPEETFQWLDSHRDKIEERMYIRLFQSSKVLEKRLFVDFEKFKNTSRKERSSLIKELSKTVKREHLAITVKWAKKNTGSPDSPDTDISNMSMTHYKQGIFDFNRDNKEVILEEFEKAVAIKPDHADAHFLLGTGYHTLKDGVNAILHMTEAEKLYEKNHDTANLDETRSLLREYRGKYGDKALEER